MTLRGRSAQKPGNYDVAIMNNWRDDGLREHLGTALRGWGGGDGTKRSSISRNTLNHDRHGRKTSRPERPAGHHHQGYMQGMIVYADDEDRETIDDDIDADSIPETVAGSDDRSAAAWRFSQQLRQARENRIATAEKALPPLLAETPLPSPPPEMSCRLSRFPFAHPCEVPELIPDQEDMFGMASSPSASGPATPSVIADVFRPLTQGASPNLELGPFPKLAAEPDLPDKLRRMSITSNLTASDGLGVIREEEDDDNTDGVSILTPTEASFGTGDGDSGSARVDRHGFLTVGNRYHNRSVSSLGSASGSSGEWRPGHAPRKSGNNLFSRIRSRPHVTEECLEKRSLTPLQLSTPPRELSNYDEDQLTLDGVPPSTSSSNPSHISRADVGGTSRFFHRMPWMGGSQPKKSEAVFGVDLKESVRVAPMKIRMSHKGNSTSYRTLPLAVYKCCEFIRRAGGTHPNIFSEPGDAYNISCLKAIFSQPPTFGEHFQFEGSDYTVYDAARLTLLFLEELPKPLISPSVVKSWILLARQEGAIEPPCPRVETGLDFWTEALNRLPTANRNLTKHLLTLFAEVLLAATGTINEADARQLASAVSRAMFHQDADANNHDEKSKGHKGKPGKRNVHPTLALAFLIKKRGDYAISIGEAGSSKSKSKRESNMFLPRTREIMEWKGVS
ncbi:hypothetical protein VTI74DRAFT_9357 [Chaetomium olivicolor]